MKNRPLLQAGFLVMAAGVCSLVSNALAGPERRVAWLATDSSSAVRPSRSAKPDVPQPPQAPAASAREKTFPPHPDKPYVEISGDDAAALHGRADVPFLDARRTAVYREGHIARARPFSVWEADIDDKVKGFFAEGHDPSAPIVVYCSGGDCEDSHMLAQKLYLAGFDDVLVYKDGFPDWQKRALPIVTGPNP